MKSAPVQLIHDGPDVVFRSLGEMWSSDCVIIDKNEKRWIDVTAGFIRETEAEAKELLVRLQLFLVDWIATSTGLGSQRHGQRLEQEGLRLKLLQRSPACRDHFWLLLIADRNMMLSVASYLG